jgi:hypothetical protein
MGIMCGVNSLEGNLVTVTYDVLVELSDPCCRLFGKEAKISLDQNNLGVC